LDVLGRWIKGELRCNKESKKEPSLLHLVARYASTTLRSYSNFNNSLEILGKSKTPWTMQNIPRICKWSQFENSLEFVTFISFYHVINKNVHQEDGLLGIKQPETAPQGPSTT